MHVDPSIVRPAARRRGLAAAAAVLTVLAAGLTVLGGIASPVAAAQPTPGHGSRLVPDVPRADTPLIDDGEIWDMEVVGSGASARVFIAGSFTSLANKVAPTGSVAQPFLASYNLSTGRIDTTFRPRFGGGSVAAVQASPDGTKLFVGGDFSSVNGVASSKVASLDLTTGAPVSTFDFSRTTNNKVNALAVSNSTVYVGGRFSRLNGTLMTGLAAFDARTGAVDTGFDNQISGGIGVDGALTVQQLTLTHDDRRLLVVHTGRKIDGQDRLGMGLIDTGTTQLLPWRSHLWDDNLARVGGVTRIYGADVSPDDSYFVVVSGSGGDAPPISDTAVAYPLSAASLADSNVQPLWIHRAFDSTYSVAITESAVYIGGHFSWNESPTSNDPWPGLDNVGYGTGQGLSGYGLGDQVVRRDHIGALDPATGKALEWNPGSNSFEGNKAMEAWSGGLLVGGDGRFQGGVRTGRVASYDFATVPAAAQPDTTITAPIEGRVVHSDEPFVITGTGTVSAAQGRVAGVDAQVQNTSTSAYLRADGSWAAGAASLPATLGAGTTSVDWSLPVTVSGSMPLKLTARTRSSSGAQDATRAVRTIESFRFDDQTPTTSITGPAGGVVGSTTFTMTGTASDDKGVDALTYWFRDADGRYLQRDGSVGDVFTTFRGTPDVIGALSATWSYELTLPHEGLWRGSATAVDTTGQADLRSAIRDWTVDASARTPTVAIERPAAMLPPTQVDTVVVTPGAPLTFSGSATDETRLRSVEISLRNTTTRENLGADGAWGVNVSAGWHRISPQDIGAATYAWSYTTPFDLSAGTYRFAVRAVDADGLTTTSADQGKLNLQAQVSGDAPPDTTLTGASTTTATLTDPLLRLVGQATDDRGVESVRLVVFDNDTGRYLNEDGTFSSGYQQVRTTLASPGATSTAWSRDVQLSGSGDFTVAALAYDSSGQQDASTVGATARYLYYPGDAAPTFVGTLGQPVDGSTFADGRIVVTGRALDDVSIARVDVAIVDSAGRYLSSAGTFTSTAPSWRAAFLNSPGSPGSNYSYTSPVLPAGTYSVQVRATDHHDQLSEIRVATGVVVSQPANEPPAARATVACEQNVCTFDGRSSTDENVAGLTYAWYYGTGQGTGTGSRPVKTYTAPSPAGTPYTVTLTVTDQWGATDATTLPVTIVAPSTNRRPQPTFATSCSGLVCSTSSSGTVDPDAGDTLTHVWAWGDGSATTTGTGSTHTYAAAGTYTITLTSTDGWGSAASTTRSVTVTGAGGTPPNTPPVASFPAPSCTGAVCAVDGSSSTDPGGAVVSYTWGWGDGTADGSGAQASHSYATSGTYTVRLTVTDAGGLTSSTTRTVTVTAPPVTAGIRFRAAADRSGNATAATVTTPAVTAGDTMVLLASVNRTTSLGTPSGWTEVGSQTGPSGELTTRVWTKVAAPGDTGSVVRVPLGVRSKFDLTLAAYAGVDPADPVTRYLAQAETVKRAGHATPTTTVGAGDWLLSWWTEKTSTGTDWTTPGGQQVRSKVLGTGSGRVNAVLSDANGPGGSGGLTASSTSASLKAVTWSLVLNAG